MKLLGRQSQYKDFVFIFKKKKKNYIHTPGT